MICLGTRKFRQVPADAGVLDLPTFELCIQGTDPISRVVAGRQLGDQLGIQGTPTLIVNGWKLGKPPSAEELRRMVQAILDGKSPVSSDGSID